MCSSTSLAKLTCLIRYCCPFKLCVCSRVAVAAKYGEESRYFDLKVRLLWLLFMLLRICNCCSICAQAAAHSQEASSHGHQRCALLLPLPPLLPQTSAERT